MATRNYPRSPLRSANAVRNLTAEALNIDTEESGPYQDSYQLPMQDSLSSPAPETDSSLMIQELPPRPSKLLDEDPVLTRTLQLLDDGFSGVVYSGPPGTGKSWYAAEIAYKLVGGDQRRVRFVQFHPSYQYEDFVEGYVPTDAGFKLQPKHLLLMCEVARQSPKQRVVLVIDELSRSDPARVFGEALTYIETTKRGIQFYLASGTQMSIPPNLVILATMNPLDRGVDEVDMALERRFAKVAMNPDENTLMSFLTNSSLSPATQTRIRNFFLSLARHQNEYLRIGHAYFRNVTDVASLQRLWDSQLSYIMDKALRLDREEYVKIERQWSQIVESEKGSDGS